MNPHNNLPIEEEIRKLRIFNAFKGPGLYSLSDMSYGLSCVAPTGLSRRYIPRIYLLPQLVGDPVGRYAYSKAAYDISDSYLVYFLFKNK